MESQRFLLLLFYTALPPGRSKEFQTLHYRIHDTLPQPAVDPAQANCLHITDDGRQAYILLGDYKTHKSYGDHFQPLREGQLLQHLALHLNTHRPALVGPASTTTLFLVSTPPHIHSTPPTNTCILIAPLPQNERGAPYTAGSWTSYVEGTLERHTGRRIGPTMIRSIFVTHCERVGLSEAEKEAMAASMRHSRRAVSAPWTRHHGEHSRCIHWITYIREVTCVPPPPLLQM